MPFDPLWQLLDYPLSSLDFQKGTTPDRLESSYFNYKDSIAIYEQQTEIAQLKGTKRRIQENGVRNSVTFNALNNVEIQIGNYNVRLYNTAADKYNECVNDLNQFITYRNNLFRPKKAEEEVRVMIGQAEQLLIESKELLASIDGANENTLELAFKLKDLLQDIEKDIMTHKAIVD